MNELDREVCCVVDLAPCSESLNQPGALVGQRVLASFGLFPAHLSRLWRAEYVEHQHQPAETCCDGRRSGRVGPLGAEWDPHACLSSTFQGALPSLGATDTGDAVTETFPVAVG